MPSSSRRIRNQTPIPGAFFAIVRRLRTFSTERSASSHSPSWTEVLSCTKRVLGAGIVLEGIGIGQTDCM